MKKLKKFLKNKRGFTLAQLSAAAIAFVVIAITIAMGARILDEMQDEFTSQSYAYNVTEKGLESLETFGDWLPIVAIAVIAAVVIGIVIIYFGRYRARA